MPKYMTAAEVGELVRAPVESVRYWRHVGKGPRSFKIGRRVLYDQAEVERFISEAQRGAADDAA